MAIDDFAGPRIRNRATVRPSSRRARNPFDDVVTNIHGIDTLGQHLHLKGVFVSRRREGLIPPTRPFDYSGANRLGDGAIDIVDDGPDGFADRRGRIFFRQPVMRDVALHNRLIHRRCKIHEADTKEARSRIVGAQVKARGGSLNERDMLVNCDGVRLGSDLVDPASRTITD